jgi:hypothetical protein
MAKPLETLVARASVIPVQQKGRTKSSKQIAAKELRPLDTVLQKMCQSYKKNTYQLHKKI